MDYVKLPVSETPRSLPFYLAVEEWLARRYPERELFFMWQVEPTVIIGRNQLLTREVDVDFCRRRGIRIVRRKSGGGAVLADMNNIMFSCITSGAGDVASSFRRYTSMVAGALRLLGLDASDNSRNDILIGERKVSGNSYYRSAGRSIVHGTMLYDFDAPTMGAALSPSASKLAAHGVESVRSRVTTIREHLPSLSIDEFMAHMERTLPDGELITLTPQDVAEIEELSRFYSDEWLRQREPRASLTASQRIPGVGEVGVHLALSEGRIASIEFSGDFLECDGECDAISAALLGAEFTPESVEARLAPLDLPRLMHGLKISQLLDILF